MKHQIQQLGLIAFSVALSALVGSAADLDALAVQAAKYESGGGEEPLRQIEQLLRESAGKPAERAGGESVLIRMLAPEATFEAKRFACYTLAVYGSEAAVPALAALLRRDETAGIACFALARIPSAKAGDGLRSALAEAKGTARVQLIVALGHRAEAESAGPLAGLLHDADLAVVRAAVRALGAIGAPAAREAVSALRREANPSIAADVAVASLAVADTCLCAGDRKAAAAVCDGYLSPDCPPHVRRGAFGLLLKCDADGGAARLRKALEASPPDATLAPVAIAHIAALRGASVSKEFGGLLPRLPPAEQALLVEALACRADEDARAIIRAQVAAADPAVRRAAVGAVGRLEDVSAVALLAQAAKAAASPDEEKDVLAALASLRGGEATDQAIADAVRRAEGKDKLRLADALSRRGGRVAVTLLLELAGAADEQVARAAGQALVRIADGGDTASLSALQQAVAAGDARSRNASLRALVAWRGTAAWDTLLEVYRKSAEETERSLALRGLLRIAGEGNASPGDLLIGRYRQLAEGVKTDAERKMILGALAGVAHPDALALALAYWDAPGVRAEAAQAVEKIARKIEKSHPDRAKDALQKVKGNG